LSPKPHRMRVKVSDGNPREPNKVKGQLVPHVDVIDAKNKIEFVICAIKPKHLDQVRAKLAAAGLEEVVGGDSNVSMPVAQPRRSGRATSRRDPALQPSASSGAPNLQKKPYGFVPLPDQFSTAPPVWHDGTCAGGRLSGELRCELETLTPMLVGWERAQIVPTENEEVTWPVPFRWINREGKEVEVQLCGKKYRSSATKSLLCPLRAPWGDRPVILPGDSLKGLLRHELGALLGAPMERVAERSYSYRPNALYPKDPRAYLVPRLARVPKDGVQMRPLGPEHSDPQVRVPIRLDLLPENLQYDKDRRLTENYYRFDEPVGAPYRGGQGAGVKLNSKRNLHNSLATNPSAKTNTVNVPEPVQQGYLATLRHLTNLEHGHFSERHPDVPNTVTGEDARRRILEAAAREVFQPGDLIWVEWDTQEKRIVSLGWHYYYRWAHVDTVRRKRWFSERNGLFPLPEERTTDTSGAPKSLSAVRRLFGYTGDNDGSKGIGHGDHEQLMGRISINAALEVVPPGAREEDRFLLPTFLKELGMPRPSAVEFYLKQAHYPNMRPSDKASLVTYGDAAGYDEPGELAGRKFYLDRADAYDREPWKDDSEANRLNDRSTLALEASRQGRRFRFTVRFRDLDPAELAAVLLAFCPHQFREDVKDKHPVCYCSKLGYARPLGWGAVRIEVKELHLLKQENSRPTLELEADIRAWFRKHFQPPPMLSEWLATHRHKHPDAADYPRKDGEIYSFHTALRAEHSRLRRYRR
jgi:hypothetical protein